MLGAVQAVAAKGTSLIVTVDNGISALDEISYAVRLGMDVVVTDHHQPRETLPSCSAVVNPHRRDQQAGYHDLAGVGVAFKLVCAMEGDDGSEMLEYYSDLVALGTIADMVPLRGENRCIGPPWVGKPTTHAEYGACGVGFSLWVSGKGDNVR